MGRLRTRILLGLALACLPAPALAPEGAARADERSTTSLSEIAARVRAGDDAAALAELARLPRSVRDASATLYLEGRLAERTGALVRAEAAYARAIALDLPSHAVRDATTRRARLLARIGRCAEARPLLTAEGSARARAIAGECALEEGLLDEAIALLSAVDREAPGPVDGVAVRLALAEAWSRKGDRARALGILRTTWLERPTHRDRASIEAALRALDPAALERTLAEREAMVEVLANAGAFTEARRALAALDVPEALDARIARERRLADFAMRSRAYEDAASSFERAFELSHDDADAFARARALVRAGSHTRALPLLDTIGRAHPNDTIGDDARHLAADVALGLDSSERAIAYVARRSDARAQELRLGLLLHALVHGDLTLAKAHVDSAGRVEDSFREERGRYLRARVLELERNVTEATSVYRALFEAAPFGYYGLASAVRLRGLGATIEPPSLALGTPPAAPPLPEDVAFYHALGLEEDARATLRRAEPMLRSRLGLSGLVAMYLAIDGAARAHALARGEVIAGKTVLTDTTRALFHAAYPRPYQTEVSTAARLVGVREAHVFGTMRQESAYDPDARSQVGALGLLQVMPATARRVARDLGLAEGTVDPFDPHTNVRLGIGEMGSLSRRFGGQLPLMIAAYNAGTARVVRWLPSGQRMASDLFIERIPYDETRGYVRRVLGHFAVYSAIEGHPEQILEGLVLEVVGHDAAQ